MTRTAPPLSNQVFENGQRWRVVSGPKRAKRHQCELPGRWARRAHGVVPGTLIRCLDCDRYWRYLGANDWQQQTADGGPIANFASPIPTGGTVPPDASL